MKLYFYFLKDYGANPHISCEECEVKETPKNYKPIDEFPSGYYFSTVKKDDIGEINSYKSSVVVLTEKNSAKVADIFIKSKCELSISNSKKRIKDEEANIDKQKSLIEMIEKWRNT